MQATLYVLPGSHPCACIEAALRVKRIAYRRVDVPPVVHRLIALRASPLRPRFPMVRIDGRYISDSGRIMRELDRLCPEPPLVPREPARRAAVEEAERWGDERLQPAARRIAWAAFNRDRRAIQSYAADASFRLPDWLVVAGAYPAAQIARAANRAYAPAVRRDLAALPDLLDRVDGWLADGTLDPARPSTADLQIGSSVRILGTFSDLAPQLDGRPCLAHARHLFPRYPGEVPAGTLPAAWLAPTRAVVSRARAQPDGPDT